MYLRNKPLKDLRFKVKAVKMCGKEVLGRMKMRVTVCELPDWNFLEKRNDPLSDLTRHVRDERSDLVVLPEMPAYPWFASIPRFSENVWREAVKAHDEFVSTLSSFPAAVISTKPVQMGNQRLNQAFFWDRSAYHPVRCKYCLRAYVVSQG